MSKVLNKQIENEITNGLTINDQINQPINLYKLPKFEKNANGELFYVGNVTISTIEEFKEYKKNYGEIAEHLNSYKKNIGNIYRNTLNSMIADNTKYIVGKNDYSLSKKLSKRAFKASTIRNSSENYLGLTLNYLTKAAFSTKRLKPCSKLNELMRNAKNNSKNERENIYVLPVMTENGVILNQTDNGKAFEASFEIVSAESAEVIKNFLIGETSSLNSDDASQIVNFIEVLFSDARNIGEMIEMGNNENLADNLENLAHNFSDLIGIDLSEYSKITAEEKKNAKKDTKSTEIKAKVETETQKKTNVDANEILIDGIFKTEPAVENGKVVTKLTPDGLKFLIQLKDKKLLVKNVETEVETSGFGE